MQDSIRIDEARSSMYACASRAMAQALVLGIDECAQTGRPLSQLQQISLTTMALMAYREVVDGADLLDVDPTALLHL